MRTVLLALSLSALGALLLLAPALLRPHHPSELLESTRDSELADLTDSPLILAKREIDHEISLDDDEPQPLSPKAKARCQGLMCSKGGVWKNDFLSESEKRMKDYLEGVNPDKDNKPYRGLWLEESPYPADTRALIKALKQRLKALESKFLSAKALFKDGPVKEMRIKVKPRGPRGVPGPPGHVGPQGPNGPRGDFGPLGHRGRTGRRGGPGARGRSGKKGPVGSIGKPGPMGFTGPKGQTGKTGAKGKRGARGLAGSSGINGANGKDGPPGPPGLDAGMGPPGPQGPIGPPGVSGNPGTPGVQGPRGVRGSTGKTGETGRMGARGTAGADGVGPRAPAVLLTSGSWPEGKCYTKGSDCSKFGVTDNLCGLCKPVCKRCKPSDGFLLENENGLRFKGRSFDDNEEGAGSNQARNICMLAKYGNRGKISQVATKKSYGTVAEKHVDQPHWFGNCDIGSKDDSECCSNANLLKSGFDWTKFSVGNSCAGDGDSDRVLYKVHCIFDDNGYAKALVVPPVSSDLKIGQTIKSDGEDGYEKSLKSSNGAYELNFAEDGTLRIISKAGTVKWKMSGKVKEFSKPFTLRFGTGGLRVVDNGEEVVWRVRSIRPRASNKLVLTNSGNLKIMDGKTCVWGALKCSG